jgi:hypothetical protein
MISPKRIILSRKGFDRGSGGCPSPIFQDGTMFSIPIPENNGHKVDEGHVRFENLEKQGKYRFPKELVTSSRSGKTLVGPVHLDPDIRPGLRPQSISKDCSSFFIFGQDGGPQTHLANQGVSKGDLFLFFGLFRRATLVDDVASFDRSSKNMHVIWGWLQIGEIHHLDLHGIVPECLRSATYHPHIHYRERINNCIYVGTPSLSVCKKLGGSGIFERYDEDLRLTTPQEDRCSYWTLPSFFVRAGLTHNAPDKWDRHGEYISGKTAGRGQEFVAKTDGIEDKVGNWLNLLFRHA